MRLDKQWGHKDPPKRDSARIPSKGISVHIEALADIRKIQLNDVRGTKPKPKKPSRIDPEKLKRLIQKCLQGDFHVEDLYKIINSQNNIELTGRLLINLLSTAEWAWFFRQALSIERKHGKVFMRETSSMLGEIFGLMVDERVYMPMRIRKLQYEVFHELSIIAAEFSLEVEQREYQVFKLQSKSNSIIACGKQLQVILRNDYQGKIDLILADIVTSKEGVALKQKIKNVLNNRKVELIKQALQKELHDGVTKKHELKQVLLGYISGEKIIPELNAALGKLDGFLKDWGHLIDSISSVLAKLESGDCEVGALVEELREKISKYLTGSIQINDSNLSNDKVILQKELIGFKKKINSSLQSRKVIKQRLEQIKLQLPVDRAGKIKKNISNLSRHLTDEKVKIRLEEVAKANGNFDKALLELQEIIQSMPVGDLKNKLNKAVNNYSQKTLEQEINELYEDNSAAEIKDDLADILTTVKSEIFFEQARALELNMDQEDPLDILNVIFCSLSEKDIKLILQNLTIEKEYGKKIIGFLEKIYSAIGRYKDELPWLRAPGMMAKNFLIKEQKLTDINEQARYINGMLLTRTFAAYIAKLASAKYLKNNKLGFRLMMALTLELSDALQKSGTNVGTTKLANSKLSPNVIRYFTDEKNMQVVYKLAWGYTDAIEDRSFIAELEKMFRFGSKLTDKQLNAELLKITINTLLKNVPASKDEETELKAESSSKFKLRLFGLSSGKLQKSTNSLDGIKEARALLKAIALLSFQPDEKGCMHFSAEDLQTLIKEVDFERCIQVLCKDLAEVDWNELYRHQLYHSECRDITRALFQEKMEIACYKPLCNREIQEPILFKCIQIVAKLEIVFEKYQLAKLRASRSKDMQQINKVEESYQSTLLKLAFEFINILKTTELPAFWVGLCQTHAAYYYQVEFKYDVKKMPYLWHKIIEWFCSNIVFPVFRTIIESRYSIDYPVGSTLRSHVYQFLRILNQKMLESQALLQYILEKKPATEGLTGAERNTLRKERNEHRQKLFLSLTSFSSDANAHSKSTSTTHPVVEVRRTAIKLSTKLQVVQFNAAFSGLLNIVHFNYSYAEGTKKRIVRRFVRACFDGVNKNTIDLVSNNAHYLLDHLINAKRPELEREESKLKQIAAGYYNEYLDGQNLKVTERFDRKVSFLALSLKERYLKLESLSLSKKLNGKFKGKGGVIILLLAKQYFVQHDITELTLICNAIDSLATSMGLAEINKLKEKDIRRIRRRSENLNKLIGEDEQEIFRSNIEALKSKVSYFMQNSIKSLTHLLSRINYDKKNERKKLIAAYEECMQQKKAAESSSRKMPERRPFFDESRLIGEPLVMTNFTKEVANKARRNVEYEPVLKLT